MPADPMDGIEAELNRRLLAAAVLLQAEHKRDLSKTYPPASQPGEYPAARTLNLRDAVGIQPVEGGYRVGYYATAKYVAYLAARRRKTVRDTAARIAGRLRRIAGG